MDGRERFDGPNEKNRQRWLPRQQQQELLCINVKHAGLKSNDPLGGIANARACISRENVAGYF